MTFPDTSNNVSLWNVAAKVYGNPHKWHVLYNANLDRVNDPDNVPAGVKLIIPNLGQSTRERTTR